MMQAWQLSGWWYSWWYNPGRQSDSYRISDYAFHITPEAHQTVGLSYGIILGQVSKANLPGH